MSGADASLVTALADRYRIERELGRGGMATVYLALSIATETARALDAAHGRGILHRDVKPENLLLTPDGSTLVADFGIARAAAEPTGLTQTGVVVGTPAYMSPEQAAGERALDARSDVYAIGCVLHEMLAGAQPFTGHTVQALLARRLSEPVPPLAPVRDVPAAVERTVLRALALRRGGGVAPPDPRARARLPVRPVSARAGSHPAGPTPRRGRGARTGP